MYSAASHLSCKAKRQYPLTLQVSRYCLLAWGSIQKAVSAYFTSKQILPFGFAEQWHTEHLLGDICLTSKTTRWVKVMVMLMHLRTNIITSCLNVMCLSLAVVTCHAYQWEASPAIPQATRRRLNPRKYKALTKINVVSMLFQRYSQWANRKQHGFIHISCWLGYRSWPDPANANAWTCLWNNNCSYISFNLRDIFTWRNKYICALTVLLIEHCWSILFNKNMPFLQFSFVK